VLSSDGALPDLVASLARYAGMEERILVTGHKPQLSRLTSLPVSGSVHAAIELHQAGVIGLEVDEILPRKCARLPALWDPEDLA